MTRGYLRRKYNLLCGEALFKRSICKNDKDFLTMEDINKILYNDFISIKIGKNIWGFNFVSLFNLFIKTRELVVYNPYSREELGYDILVKLKKIIHLSKVLKSPINIVLNKDENNFCQKKKIEFHCLELFQYMDELGNYTKCDWFLSLTKYQIIKFIRELMDIWEYRAQLTDKVKREICYPYGQPFISYSNIQFPSNINFIYLQKNALSIIENFIKSGINKESNILGTSFVLCALTLVNEDAAEALPWLYQSVSNNF